jgi:thiamine biosynthesis protein ThiS
MQILCNGRQHDIDEGSTLGNLLEDLNLSPDTVVAEINKKVIDRDQYEALILSEGDQVELIRFVGGG